LTAELATFGCAACGEAYGDAHIRLIAQREELFFVDLSCDHCGTQAVAIVTIQIDGDGASLESGELVPHADSGSHAERGKAALRRGAATPPINADDVLDVHELLAGFEGDVHRLMARLDGEVS
jgi:hypothetical protein